MPANVRPGNGSAGVDGHKVAVVPLKERAFKSRSYWDVLKVHKEMREAVERGKSDTKSVVKVLFVLSLWLAC